MKNMDLEKDLIARAVAGEQEALAEVLDGVQDMVFGLSLRMLGPVSYTHLAIPGMDSPCCTLVVLISAPVATKSTCLLYTSRCV